MKNIKITDPVLVKKVMKLSANLFFFVWFAIGTAVLLWSANVGTFIYVCFFTEVGCLAAAAISLVFGVCIFIVGRLIRSIGKRFSKQVIEITRLASLEKETV